jgi:hypothetical protein
MVVAFLGNVALCLGRRPGQRRGSMGVDIYGLEDAIGEIRVGERVHEVGVISRLWKVTETDLCDSRADTLDALEDAQRERRHETPRAVIVDNQFEFGEQGGIRASLVLGWPAGTLKTQDYDWDHLPQLGWAVETSDGPPVLHEQAGEALLPMSEARAIELGVLDPNGALAEQYIPQIAACRSVATLGDTYYAAECTLRDGRQAQILGESESGALPPTSWFVGRTTEAASRYRLPDQIGTSR